MPLATSAQPMLSSFVSSSTTSMYASNHPKQKLLTKSLVENLIVGCGLPISLVENEYFRKFMADVDSHYTAPCRKTVTDSYLPALLKIKQDSLKKLLADATDAAITVDIWLDRRQHTFLGVIGHIYDVVSRTLKTQLIAFKSFRGAHTGSRIAEVLEETLTEDSLRSKVHFMVTDNASNMKKATTFLFHVPDNDNEDSEDGAEVIIVDDDAILDDPSLFEDVTLDELNLRQDAISGERLPCFAHSLQ